MSVQWVKAICWCHLTHHVHCGGHVHGHGGSCANISPHDFWDDKGATHMVAPTSWTKEQCSYNCGHRPSSSPISHMSTCIVWGKASPIPCAHSVQGVRHHTSNLTKYGFNLAWRPSISLVPRATRLDLFIGLQVAWEFLGFVGHLTPYFTFPKSFRTLSCRWSHGVRRLF